MEMGPNKAIPRYAGLSIYRHNACPSEVGRQVLEGSVSSIQREVPTMYIFEYLRIIFMLLWIFAGVIGMSVLLLAFFGDMEIVYKAKILGTKVSRTTKLLDRIAWGFNGVIAVFSVLIDRRELYRLIALREMEGELEVSYAPMKGTILIFHANEEEEGEPLYVMRPFEYLADDWKDLMGRGI